MERELNQFQSTRGIRAKNLKGLESICEHLKEELDLIVVGPEERRLDKRFFEAKLNGHKGSNAYRFIELIFDNKNCQLTMTFCHPVSINAGSCFYDMGLYNESMLTKIRTTTREWIYDNVISD